MKLKVYGGGGSFSVKLNDSDDHVLVLSKGLTAYETAHELATWLEDVTEAIVVRGPADVAPETLPEPATQPQVEDERAHVDAFEAHQAAQAESLEHGSPGSKFGSPGVTDWTDQGQPDFTKPVNDSAHAELAPVPAPVAPAPTEPAPAPTPAEAAPAAPEAAPEPPKGAA